MSGTECSNVVFLVSVQLTTYQFNVKLCSRHSITRSMSFYYRIKQRIGRIEINHQNNVAPTFITRPHRASHVGDLLLYGIQLMTHSFETAKMILKQ